MVMVSMYILNRSGPNIEPCGTPEMTYNSDEIAPYMPFFHSSGMTPELIDLLKRRVKGTDTDSEMGFRRVMGMLYGYVLGM